MSEQKKVVILLFRYSVVVKGIERNLCDLGYNVEIVTENFDCIEENSSSTDIYIMYLPGDIMDDRVKLMELGDVCKTIAKLGQKMMIIGETKYHMELSAAVPAIDEYAWLDRPVENNTLAVTVENVIAGKAQVRGKKRVLIVDDDPSYAGMVREWIKESYKTDVVTAGLQAVSFLMKNKVDLVLLDYEMPGVNGPGVLKMLRQEEATKDLRVVFLTGVGTKEEVAKVMEMKPDGYVLKSTTRDNLIAYINKKLG